MAGKTRLDVVVAQTKASPEVTVTVPPGCEHLADGPTLTGPAAVVLCQLLGAHLPDIQVGRAPGVAWPRGRITSEWAWHALLLSLPQPFLTSPPAPPHPPPPAQEDTFTSSDPSAFRAASGNLAVSANVRTSNGWLFPLPGALLFLGKPAHFVRHSEVAGWEFARVGATSSTFDMTVHLAGGGRVEFGQVDQGELPRLQAYVAERRLPVRLGGGAGRGGGAAAGGRGCARVRGRWCGCVGASLRLTEPAARRPIPPSSSARRSPARRPRRRQTAARRGLRPAAAAAAACTAARARPTARRRAAAATTTTSQTTRTPTLTRVRDRGCGRLDQGRGGGGQHGGVGAHTPTPVRAAATVPIACSPDLCAPAPSLPLGPAEAAERAEPAAKRQRTDPAGASGSGAGGAAGEGSSGDEEDSDDGSDDDDDDGGLDDGGVAWDPGLPSRCDAPLGRPRHTAAPPNVRRSAAPPPPLPSPTPADEDEDSSDVSLVNSDDMSGDSDGGAGGEDDDE
jgi:hypothetical protein